MNGTRLGAFALTCLWAVACPLALAHTDLQEQIDELTRQLADHPDDAGLYLKRGDLYRRHQEWSNSAEDFSAVRRVNADHPLLDWFEGRMRVDAGDFAAGRNQLSRFISAKPGHAGALQARARAHWALGNPAGAAEDYRQAIRQSEHPSPGLYRSLVVTLAYMGPSRYPAAREVVDQALDLFPLEVTLLGLGAELAILDADIERVSGYLERLPPRILELGQWVYRTALADCVAGKAAAAGARFRTLIESEPNADRSTTWQAPLGTLTLLSEHPTPGACRAAALQSLATYPP